MGVGQPMPAGVRAVTGERQGRLVWVSAEALGATRLERGTRVLVRDGSSAWLGEIVVAPETVLESPPLADPPVIMRLATQADAWPTSPERSGRTWLDSLKLPADQLEPAPR